MFADRNALAAAEWANKRQEKLERARQIRMERSKGRIEADHTFTPVVNNNNQSRKSSRASSRGSSTSNAHSHYPLSSTPTDLPKNYPEYDRKMSFDSTGSIGLGYSKPTTSVGHQIVQSGSHVYGSSPSGNSARQEFVSVKPLYNTSHQPHHLQHHQGSPSSDSLTSEIQRHAYWPKQTTENGHVPPVPQWNSTTPHWLQNEEPVATDQRPASRAAGSSRPRGIPYDSHSMQRGRREEPRRAARALTAGNPSRSREQVPEFSPRYPQPHTSVDDEEMVFEFAATTSLLVSRNQSALVFSSDSLQSTADKAPSGRFHNQTVPPSSRTRLSLLKDRLGSSNRRLRRGKTPAETRRGPGEHSLSSRRHSELRKNENKLERSKSATGNMESYNSGEGLGTKKENRESNWNQTSSSTGPPAPAKKAPCTRQSGCQCTQCSADASFQSMLRSSPKASSGRKLSRRPEWNTDFSSPNALGSLDSDGEESRVKQQGRTGTRQPPRQRKRSDSYKVSPRRSQAEAPSAETQNETRRVEAMRDAMGGKRDFIEQVQTSGHASPGKKGPRRQTSEYLPPQAAGAQQPFSRDGRQLAGEVGYRGMFRPREAGSQAHRSRYLDDQTNATRYQDNAREYSERSAHGSEAYRSKYPSDESDRGTRFQSTGGQQSKQFLDTQGAHRERYQRGGAEGQQHHHYGGANQGQENRFQTEQAAPTSTRDITRQGASEGYGGSMMVDPITGEVVTEQSNVQLELIPCRGCGRKFKEESLNKHLKVCSKVFQSKRPTFNTAEARLNGIAQTQEDADKLRRIARNGGARKQSPKKKPSSKKWQKHSQKLREAMKYNKLMAKAKAAGKSLASLPPPPEDENEDFIQCPHCSRTFNPHAAERHIPKCKDQKARPKRLMRGSGHSAVSRR